MKHPYANILHAIADGREVQWYNTGTGWENRSHTRTLGEISNEYYEPERYRVKPDTVNIAGYEVVKPMTEAPEVDKEYWFINLQASDGIGYYHWTNNEVDHQLLLNGMCWLNKQDALDAVTAIQSALKGETK